MDGSSTEHPRQTEVERVFREVYGQAIATLTRVLGDITLAEDAVQHAFACASERWAADGMPPNPSGWIVTTARNRAIDHHRREVRGLELHAQLGTNVQASYSTEPEDWEESEPMHDDQLRLIFTCCHPSLRIEHQVALTLRLLGGLTVDEVARSFLTSEAAMAKRLVRAKYKIKAANIPYRVPEGTDLPERLRPVLAAVYLIYNTGADDPGRSVLRTDAIRLARALVDLMPDEPETSGLLALLVLTESRIPARRRDDELVVLRDQDRTLWDRPMIDEGHAIVRACIQFNQPGPYQLQAAIQAVHCDAASFDDTDWHQIVILYDRLYSVLPTPVVALNRAIAIGEVEGPEVALAEIDAVAPALDGYHLMHSARATALRRLNRLEDARDAFALAAALAQTSGERRFLEGQLAELSDRS